MAAVGFKFEPGGTKARSVFRPLTAKPEHAAKVAPVGRLRISDSWTFREGSRKPREMDAEDELHDGRDQEVRENDAYENKGTQNIIRCLVLIERPKTADGDADDDGDQEGSRTDGEGVGQACSGL